jgi:hypothetical protein
MVLKVYGPYTRKDGRKHIILYDFEKGIRRTVSYPKYLLEQKLGRELEENETCDHKDEDFTNDDLDNLQPLLRVDNARKSIKPAKLIIVSCAYCNKEFEIKEARYNRNQINLGKAGPYCSRRCQGKIHH